MTGNVNNDTTSYASMHSCARNQCYAQPGLHDELMESARKADADRAGQTTEDGQVAVEFEHDPTAPGHSAARCGCWMEAEADKIAAGRAETEAEQAKFDNYMKIMGHLFKNLEHVNGSQETGITAEALAEFKTHLDPDGDGEITDQNIEDWKAANIAVGGPHAEFSVEMVRDFLAKAEEYKTE